jgi:HAD superfamily hydrolase (TIGR01509 family)
VALRGLSLDALGTLLWLEPPAPALRRVLAERHGVSLTEEQARRAIAAEIAFYRAHLGEGVDDQAVTLLRGRCAEALRAALAAERALDSVADDDLTAALLEALVFRVFPEVAAVLRSLRAAGLRLVVTSNWDASLVSTLETVGLRGLVDGVVCSAAVGAAKPDARVFARALEVAEVPRAEAAHVGDAPVEDVAGARAAGLRAVLVRRGGSGATGGVSGDVPGVPAGVPAGVPVIASLAELPGALGLSGASP